MYWCWCKTCLTGFFIKLGHVFLCDLQYFVWLIVCVLNLILLVMCFSECKTAKVADIVFIVDESSSINHDDVGNFNLMRKFMGKILKDLDISPKGVHVGLATYSDKPRLEFHLNTYDNSDDVLRSIKRLPYRGGNTYTGDALKFALTNMFTSEHGSRRDSGVQQIAIVITDGESHDNVSGPALALRDFGVKVYAVGIKSANATELKQIASDPVRSFVVIIDDFVMLNSLDSILTKKICREITKPPPPKPKRKGQCSQQCLKSTNYDKL